MPATGSSSFEEHGERIETGAPCCMDDGNALPPPGTWPEEGDAGTQLPAWALPPLNHWGLSSEGFFFLSWANKVENEFL